MMTVRETFITHSGGERIVVTPLSDWCESFRVEMFKVLGDIEALGRMMTGQEKEDWEEEEIDAYERIRKRLLDNAGAIARMPGNLMETEVILHDKTGC